MRSMRVVGPRRFDEQELPNPEVIDGQVLIKLERLSVCGSDLRIFDRILPEEDYPLESGRPCHECAGVIVESKNDSLEVGQRVIVLPSTSAGLVEYLAEPPERIIPIPSYGDLSSWVMCQHMGTVMYSADRLGSVVGKRVVVLGQGPIGLNFTYWMSQLGAKQIIAVDLLDYRLTVSEKLGATETINSSKDDVIKAIPELTDGNQADVVIEAAGTAETINQMFSIIRKMGTAVLFGQPHYEDVLPINYDVMMSSLATILPTISSRPPNDPTSHIKHCVDLVDQKRINLDHLVTHSFPFGDAQKAFELYSDKEDNVLKVIMEL